jgi:uncharacterized protein YndB with AHSA1/START domain
MAKKTLHFEIEINAPRERVWQNVIGKESYPIWTEPFSVGSTFEGGWNKGDKISFVSKNAEGQQGGMFSQIAENRAPEFLSVQHLGLVKNGVEDSESEEAKKWVPAFENYTLTEKNGGTLFAVDLVVDEAKYAQYEEMFSGMWPMALAKLKEISEKK